MENFGYIDMFATKGIEYILVIGFLILFVAYWVWMNRSTNAQASKLARQPVTSHDWFHLMKGRYYHQGHSWVIPQNRNVVRIGIDDFAQKLLGKPTAIMLPDKGTILEQGNKGWKLKFDDKKIDMLSPVSGKVIKINQEALQSTDLITKDPYERGWLMEVEVDNLKPNLTNLLSGPVAVAWLENVILKLREKISPQLGLVMQDGGIPVSGFAREISPDNWEDIATDFLLTK